jgi:hypothetical protein
MTDAPYADAAQRYLARGWSGVLPIKGKFPPPTGFTGADAPWPSAADVMSWATGPEGNRNIGLRLPPHVIGIDVDDYDDKVGGSTLGDAEAVWGSLPDTWIATSRDDGVSGIRLFTVPPGLKWPGVVGLAVEVIQTRHRYSMVWPSIHPTTGQRYEWIMPDGDIASIHAAGVPAADDLPMLPAAWVAGLTKGEAATDVEKVDLGPTQVSQWLAGMSAANLQPCPVMDKATLRALADLAHGVSRHDAAMRATARLTLLRAEGHTGMGSALGQVLSAFLGAVGNDAGRDARGEWDRMIEGAVKMAAARPPATLDPCKLMGGANYSPPIVAAPPQVGSRSNAATAVAAVPRLTVVPELPNGEPQPAAEATPAPVPDLDPSVALELHTQRARREAKRILDVEEQEKGFQAPPYVPTLAQELALPDERVHFRVGEVLPVGANVLLTAQYKSGKTTLINHLVKCMADGDPFLGQLPIERLAGKIAIFNYEVSAAQYRRWLREVGIAHPERVLLLNLRGQKLPLTTPAATRWIIEFLARNEVTSWVLDPFARAAVGSVTNENDNTEVGYLLDHLDYVKAQAGVRELVIAAHTGRAEQEEGQERARGATRLDDWADVRWFLTKDAESGQRFFRASGRDVEYEEKALEFNESTRRLSITGGSRKEARGDRVKNAVRAAIINSPDIAGKAIEQAVRATLGKVDDKAIRLGISELEHDGEIVITRQGVGRPNLHRMAPPRSPFGPVR